MQQQIGFCTTADGVRIAYATVGAGPALVVAPWAPSHLGLEWEEPRIRDFWAVFGRHHQVVRYDKHGFGLSDRKRSDFSLDSEVRTIEAIPKELGLKSFVLWGQCVMGGAAAIAYAAKFPDRVSHLILCNGQAHGAPAWGRPDEDAVRALGLSNLRIASLAIAEAMLGSAFNDASALRWYLRTREESTPEILNQLLDAQLYNMDLRDLLPKVRVPTLVVHYRNNRAIPFEAGRELAAGIPGARFVPLEDGAHYFYFCDTRPLRRTIAEFLGDPVEDAGQPRSDAATSPPPAEATQGAFRKEGEFWTIACRDKTFRIKDVRGLAYIAYLLGHPREEIHVLSLASKVGGELPETTEGERATQPDLTVGRMGDAGEMLDAQAKAAYKRRTAELREQLEEARERGQPERVDQLEEEIEDLGRELSRAVGLGGRDRRAASAAERARINVTRAIKVALERIAEHNPALATLLTNSIRTGTFCSYTPDSRLPACWQL